MKNIKLLKMMFLLFLSVEVLYSKDFSLREVVSIVLEDSLEIRKYKKDESIAYAKIQQEKGKFDFNVNFYLTGGRDYYELSETETYSSIFYGFNFKNITKIGLSYGGEFKAIHSFKTIDGSEIITHTPYGSLSLTLPLLKSWNPKINAGSEVSAEMMYEVSKLETIHEIETQISKVLVLYMKIVELHGQLELLNEYEARTRKMIKEYSILVEKNNIPANDLNIIKAQLSTIIVNRINIENDIILKEEDLKSYSSSFPAEIRLTTLLPIPTDFFSKKLKKTKENIIEKALATKCELIAKRKVIERSYLAKKISENDKKHELNLVLEGSAYKDYNQFDLDPVFTGYVSLQYLLPLENNKSKGMYSENLLHLEKNLIELEIMKKETAKEIFSNISKLEKSYHQIVARKEEIFLYKTALESEFKKFQLGQTTVFDLIDLENKYLFVRQKMLSDRFEYAEAIVELKRSSGFISEIFEKTALISVDDLLSDLDINYGH